ncbi:MAG: 2-phospho-L-lactate/phosphoenolpyruvate guanylyltransferase [Pseudonocardiales bacterium]|nr:2-phospho-L-lactate/phosphoenolpyruvate guanylyltransferase [Pseudonocardiales bacterium]
MLIPAKALPAAKSRLAATLDDDAHARLVDAIRADTLSAARATPGVTRIVVVADRPAALPDDADELLVQREPGLNAALREAAEHAARHWPEDGVAALLGDLPALRPAELAAGLLEAAGHPRAFVRDSAGTGTTLLTARPGTDLEPAFGSRSAERHAAVAVELSGGPGLRQDVDTVADLERAVALGLGVATAAETRAATRRIHLGSA